MRFITSQKELKTVFNRLLKQYEEYHWATAWAGESDLLDELILHRDRIQKIVVGIHFYQTHPKFIEHFLESNQVRFIKQPSGTFHPKIYLFFNSNDNWEMLVGSANFTNAAFTNNIEATVLFSNKDENSEANLKNALRLIEDSWKQAKVFDREELANYRITWENQKNKIKSLSGLYGSIKGIPKPIHQIPIINKNWTEFINGVRNEKSHRIDKRLSVIEIAQNLFAKSSHFNELTEDERKFIAGIPNKLNVAGEVDWGLFGRMKGSGKFKNKIKVNDSNISLALDQIPFSGQITKSQYDNFVEYFSKALKGNFIATATRLLAMKRPDTFICLDSKNKSELFKDFGIKQPGMDYQKYWDYIILRIYDCNWWQHPKPINEQEKKVSEARAAFLDSLYYKEKKPKVI